MTDVVKAADLFDLTGEVALVTGASSGLGARFAKVLLAHGARVVAAARRKDRLDALFAAEPNALPLELDVTKPQSFGAALDQAQKAFGTVTLLVNNAGIARDARFLDATSASWRETMASNLDSVWFLSQDFAQRLVKAEKPGSIVNVASMLSYRVTPATAAYSISKAAVMQMTQALAVELARHAIRVNAIAPGYIRSEMTEDYLASEHGQASIRRIPQRRAGEASDLDGTLLLLASRRASGFMTGSTIVVDGGHMWSFN